MSQTEQLPITDVNAEALAPAQTRYTETLERLRGLIPEVGDRQAELQTAGQEIIDEFVIAPEFFDDSARATVLTSIASRWASSEALSEEEKNKERTFLADSIALVAHEHSPSLKDAA